MSGGSRAVNGNLPRLDETRLEFRNRLGYDNVRVTLSLGYSVLMIPQSLGLLTAGLRRVIPPHLVAGNIRCKG